jgi:hypothetical protein
MIASGGGDMSDPGEDALRVEAGSQDWEIWIA